MKMSYVLLTCIAIFSFGLYTSWKHIVEWHVVLSHCQFQLEIACVNVATQIRLRLSQGTPFLSVPEMVPQSGPWTPPLLQLGFHLLQFRCQREDRPLPNCLCKRLCNICILPDKHMILSSNWSQVTSKKKWCSDELPLSDIAFKWNQFPNVMINAETLRYVTRLTTIRYIISLHDDAKCNNELPAPNETTVFHFALTSRAIFRFTPLSTLPLRFPWRGCWHLVEGLNLTPSRARCLGHTVE